LTWGGAQEKCLINIKVTWEEDPLILLIWEEDPEIWAEDTPIISIE